MNKVLIVVNVLLVAAVATLFGLVLSSKDANKAEEVVAPEQEEQVEEKVLLPIAYVNLDSVLVNYNFAKDADKKLKKKQKDAENRFNSKAKAIQNEEAEFQRKLQNNAFLSRERAEQAQQSIAKKYQEIQQLEAKLTQDIVDEGQKLNMQLADSLTNYLEIFNADGRYDLILSNSARDNVLMAADGYDITDQVIEGLNARYKK
jgi:outer membrane protein